MCFCTQYLNICPIQNQFYVKIHIFSSFPKRKPIVKSSWESWSWLFNKSCGHLSKSGVMRFFFCVSVSCIYHSWKWNHMFTIPGLLCRSHCNYRSNKSTKHRKHKSKTESKKQKHRKPIGNTSNTIEQKVKQ